MIAGVIGLALAVTNTEPLKGVRLPFHSEITTSEDREDYILSAERDRVNRLVAWSGEGDVTVREDEELPVSVGSYEAIVLYLAGKLYAHKEGKVDVPYATYGEIMEQLSYPNIQLSYGLESDQINEFLETNTIENERVFEMKVDKIREAINWVIHGRSFYWKLKHRMLQLFS